MFEVLPLGRKYWIYFISGREHKEKVLKIDPKMAKSSISYNFNIFPVVFTDFSQLIQINDRSEHQDEGMELRDEQSLANFFLHIKDFIVLLVINEMMVFFSSLIKAKCFKWIDFHGLPKFAKCSPWRKLIFTKICENLPKVFFRETWLPQSLPDAGFPD